MNKILIFTFTLLCFIFLYSYAFGQITRHYGIEGQYGSIIPHAEELREISSTNPVGFQLLYSQLNSSRESWEVCNCFYYLGVQVTYHDFRNPDILGQATSLSAFFEPILYKNNRLEFTLKNGMGFTYLNQVYDEVSNPLNTFYSNPFSFLLFIQPKINYKFNDRIGGNVSVLFNHISNGGQRQPNRGMNFPMVGFGMSYVLNRQQLPTYETPPLEDRWGFYIDVFGTTRKSSVSDSRKILLGASLGFNYNILPISAIGGGFEVYSDQSLIIEDLKGSTGFIAAPFISHQFNFGRFSFSQRLAYYAKKPLNYIENSFYQRYIVQYRIVQDLHFGIGLKTHAQVAENIDFRLGWKF